MQLYTNTRSITSKNTNETSRKQLSAGGGHAEEETMQEDGPAAPKHRVVRLAVLVVVGAAAVVVAVVAAHRAGPAKPPDELRDAQRLANEFVARVAPTSRVTVHTGAPEAFLVGAPMTVESENVVGAHRAWIVHAPEAEVERTLRTRRPRGLGLPQCCGTSSDGHTAMKTVTYFPTPLPDDVARAQVLVSFAARDATTTWVRADAQTTWRRHRDPDEQVPRSDHVVVVIREARTSSSGATIGAPTRIVITDPARVARIEHAFNALGTTYPFTSNGGCFGDSYTLEFRPDRNAQSDVVAHLVCDDLQVTMHGQRADSLDPSGFGFMLDHIKPA